MGHRSHAGVHAAWLREGLRRRELRREQSLSFVADEAARGGAAATSVEPQVITPGTEFMRKLATFLRAYCARRAKQHPRWKDLSFAVSDATVPGEGEHKIVNYVRALRQQEARENAPPQHAHGSGAAPRLRWKLSVRSV